MIIWFNLRAICFPDLDGTAWPADSIVRPFVRPVLAGPLQGPLFRIGLVINRIVAMVLLWLALI